MKRYALLFVPLASLLTMGVSAFGQTQYRFDFYGSVDIPRNKDFVITAPQTTTPLHGTHQFSPGVRGGVRVGADGLAHWGQDISYSYGTNPSKIVVASNGEFAYTSRTHQFFYNVLYYPGGQKSRSIFPYVTAGVGGTIFTISQSGIAEASREGLGELKTHTSFSFNAGGGIRYRVNKTYGFRIDVRDCMSHPARYGIPDASSSPQTFVFPVSGIFHQIEASIAFVYYLRSSR